MDHTQPSNWRQMFEPKRQERPDLGSRPVTAPAARIGGYDDGHDPSRAAAASLTPEEVADEAALALSVDTRDYRPWILQRGRARPAVMLHLRRFDPRCGFWTGWQVSYPHLIAVEYTGDTMLSLDFGARQFVVTGTGLGELVGHLQGGTVLTVTEFSNRVWRTAPSQGGWVSSIRCLGQGVPAQV